MQNKRIAIDLLWLRPGKVGGTESYIRNLLAGMKKLSARFDFVLICSKDNADSFMGITDDKRFSIITANIRSANIAKRIIWQNLNQNRLLRRNGIKYCFTPVYCRPIFNGRISYINTIHDIQAYHYPMYHPLHEIWFSKINWLIDKYKSRHIIAISEFVKKDLINVYKFKHDDIDVIYNPILIDVNDMAPWEQVSSLYDIIDGEYYYATSQLIPHKNFDTLIRVFDKIKNNSISLPCKLIVSGIKGVAAESLSEQLKAKGLKDTIVFTGFVDNSVRNTLYKHCRAFLFPSVFEGFGMPPVEAMYLGKPVLTTKCGSIPEVTQNIACYVDDPYNEDEWIEKMIQLPRNCEQLDFECYDETKIAEKYLSVLDRWFN